MNNSHKNSKSPTSIQIPNYQITKTVYAGSRTIVYRAVRTDDQLPVIIKLMKRQYPTFSELVQFRNQYSIAKNLDIPGIVKPYSLEPYHNGYALVMEDFGGISLQQFIQKKALTLDRFLSIALSLTDILHSIHQQRVIHKDIKPANILIHPDTKQVKLIDFSISTLLPRETQQIQSINALEGTLAYLSPEQTGRMNRGIDYRSDYYSLGITWFELLTGKLPFQSDDPMELVHCHIAKQPPNLRKRGKGKDIPQVLCDIVMKLIAKNAEDRYQSTLGLKHDLEQCLLQLNETAKIEDFQIGQRDLSDRFLIPDKLYGRAAEIETLLQAFGRVVNGSSELMLVTGFSGIGKTAIVNEVHKPIVRSKGYFIKGKYDQFQRNIPFSGLVQTFRDLMGQLLSESDAQLEQWKAKILSALGENGQVLVEVIPELEEIIGKQPSAIELAASAAQNRFNLLFVKFIEVFATLEHPLVMFLDDLQWADSASLSLMKLLMSQAEGGYLFIIGAYRDNEVFPAHPLMLALEEIQKTKATVNTIALTALSQSDVNLMIADTLSCAIERAMLLTELVYQKAKGNPFFTTQFLKALYEDGLIAFDWQTGSWQCDVAQVRSLALTDDVVEFMAVQLQKLSPATQNILKLAACIGNQFDLATLAIVSEQSEIETATVLWKALQEGIILPQSEIYKFYQNSEFDTQHSTPNTQHCSYKFLHDRIQQAAYCLIPEQQKQMTHLKIGRLLLEKTASENLEDKIFAILNQINYGVNLLQEESEREFIARLNLKAGEKAKVATAYEAALNCLNTGKVLLSNDSWETNYALTHHLYTSSSEVEYLNGNYKQAEELIAFTLKKSVSILDRVPVYRIQLQLYNVQSQFERAIEVGLSCLQELNVSLEPNPPQKQQLEVEKLSNLPLMADPQKEAAMEVLIALTAPAYAQRPELLMEIINTLIYLSIQYGNSKYSPYGYCLYGMILCATMEDIDRGYQLGQMSLDILEKLGAKAYNAKVCNIFGNCIRHWQKSARENVDLAIGVQGFYSGLETGDIEYAGYSIIHYCVSLFFLGLPLPELEKKFDDYLQILTQLKHQYATTILSIGRQTILNFQENNFSQFELPEYVQESERLESDLIANKNFTTLFLFYLVTGLFSYSIGKYQEAVRYMTIAVPYAANAPGLITVSEHNFYYSLSLLAQYPDLEESQQIEFLKIVDANQQTMKIWVNHAPENFLHQYDLVEAEKARRLRQTWQAAEYYDRAIAGAKTNGYIQIEALGNELAAKLYLDWNKEKVAAAYMQEAYYCYARWGAKAKIIDLEKRYPQLLAPILQQTRSPLSTNETIFTLASVTSTSSSTSSSSSISVALDLAAILKASQTLSGEIELEKLLSSLLHIAIENAGADKCVLMLVESNNLLILALADLGLDRNGNTQVDFYSMLSNPQPVEASQNVPIGLINTVKRSLKPAVIFDATVYPQLINDSYIQQQQPKSILCSPILRQGKLLGILYLENNLAIGAFTRDRVELLNLLCSQAAISLENARLYERSLEYAQQLEQSLENLSVSNSRFEKLVDNVPGVVYQARSTADEVRYLTYVSAECYDLFEITPVQAIANIQFLTESIHPEDTASYQQSLTDSIQTLTPLDWSGRILTPSGIVKWIHIETRIQKLADGTLVWDGLVLDISDRKRAEAAIIQKSQELEQALQNLQQTQLQMIQSEKMSALGNLVAGVAHEINNPVGFLTGNITPALDYINDLFGLIDLVQQKYPQLDPAIQEEIETIELDYIREDLPKLIESMQEGVKRIQDISISLRTFSRADSDRPVACNIHEGIDSTIMILKHRLKANDTRPEIQVIKDYGALPKIECYAGQLNQVFMNILGNAVDALNESNIGRSYAEIKANPNQIIVKTELSTDPKQVIIRIKDNGIGMSEAVRAQVFDNLFTTKEVGKGTGLGLAIARQIVVEKHSGSLNVNSIMGTGTEFIIILPIHA
ncbi:AAA family ATPase [Microcoleus sp. N3A4]|uniref:AAA family ATPase n=1 Tax=Microcoleus sp. N3A4 TaxID=3055379 RepID=UPI002FD1C840